MVKDNRDKIVLNQDGSQLAFYLKVAKCKLKDNVYDGQKMSEKDLPRHTPCVSCN